ncbi:BgTH12-01295 [Blumeria graminis f. sp. triticale]|uniref:BgtAc-30938 n=3 Tax=Blumeria graminis TaxID=34373 RepID=A0A9X9MNK1_BLUGR|nr:hypothetical protein BGT96224_Ac30938 [Blumeria graminis f. sp. tritici 96224]CAD6505808.1 BgTH12-01295 [Blumeria graminis f. sp. triticale]VDB93980.1 BgtAc-30938 [Blumeria graminis f. sp. tritici]
MVCTSVILQLIFVGNQKRVSMHSLTHGLPDRSYLRTSFVEENAFNQKLANLQIVNTPVTEKSRSHLAEMCSHSFDNPKDLVRNLFRSFESDKRLIRNADASSPDQRVKCYNDFGRIHEENGKVLLSDILGGKIPGCGPKILVEILSSYQMLVTGDHSRYTSSHGSHPFYSITGDVPLPLEPVIDNMQPIATFSLKNCWEIADAESCLLHVVMVRDVVRLLLYYQGASFYQIIPPLNQQVSKGAIQETLKNFDLGKSLSLISNNLQDLPLGGCKTSRETLNRMLRKTAACINSFKSSGSPELS